MLSKSQSSRLNRGGVAVFRVQAELHKDHAVLDNGAQRPKEPWQSVEQVGLLLRVSHETDAVRQVSGQGHHEEEKGEAYCSGVSVRSDTTGNTGYVPSHDFSR